MDDNEPGTSYDWKHDGNEIFSDSDKWVSDHLDGHTPPNLIGPGFLGTPKGTVEEYVPINGHPTQGPVKVLTKSPCGCN